MRRMKMSHFSTGGVVIRSDTKPPEDLITTHFRETLKIVGPYSHPFPAPKKIVRPYKDPLSGPEKKVRPPLYYYYSEVAELCFFVNTNSQLVILFPGKENILPDFLKSLCL